MTGYTVHTGATKKFVAGWDRIFSNEKQAKGQKGAKAAKKAGSKKKKK